ncbi:hypothetical protein GPJ56_007023 [Histomonas meleagridis]|uniref:uncharacterized protein n=1 Tax=Histomonas meleagridis TaxID=135588 RepID=UPI00355A9CC5|nr:hypothetical protein GPJ56_007023 [Histomonas meleagridis]KAH0800176.1 hypothetical protein GO595_007288 [Histomonas meleagridis]
MLDDDIPPSDLDIREPMPTDKDEYQSKFESSALVQGYSHVCHYYLKNGAAQKLQTLNIKQILHCLLSFGSYYISFQYLRPFLDQVYELIFTDPDIKLKSLCMRILSFYAKKSKAGLFFSLNKPNFPSLFNVNNDMEFVNSLLSFIHRALKQFSYLPHETSLFFIQFVVSLFDCNDDHVSNHAIYAISKGTYGGEIFSEFCLTNLITTKLFQIVYNTNTFEKQTNAVRAICDLFSVSSEVVAEEMAKMGFFQVLHDYFEPTANILMKSLLNAVNKALEIADLNPNFENWKEIIFADDEILNTIEKYAPERGHVGDYSVNSYEVLAYSILMQSMQFG